MKDIAHNRHIGLTWRRIMVCTFAFAIVISLAGLTFFKDVDDLLLELLPSKDVKVAYFFAVIGLAVLWSVLIAGLGWVFERVLTWQTTWTWPRYFFYAFKFRDGKQIVGWTKILLDTTGGSLDAIGRSFLWEGVKMTPESCVTWSAGTVAAGTFQGAPVCYILYNLNEYEADNAHRPYRDGLLRFRLLRRSDLNNPSAWPKPTSRGADQYFGHQQAIDSQDNKEWNLAYAERAFVTVETNMEADQVLTDELEVRAQSLLNSLELLQQNLKT